MSRHIFCTLVHTHIFTRYAGGVRVTLRSTTGWRQHWKCAHRKMSSMFIYPSITTCLALIPHLQKSRCLQMVGYLVLGAVDSDCCVSINPNRKIAKWILKEGWSCRVHKVKPNCSLASLTLENVVWLEVRPVVSQLLMNSLPPANILKLAFMS